MRTIAGLAKKLQRLLGKRADELGRETGFVQRRSKISGSKFSQTTVLGWLAKPNGSLSELSQTAASLGVRVSAQGIDERFGPASAELMRRLLLEAVEGAMQAEPVSIPLLQRFQGVDLLDSSVLVLPDALAEIWPGCGPTTGQAALKVMVEWDWLSGRMDLRLLPGRTHDQNNELATRVPLAGRLRVADVGFFNLKHFRLMNEADAYWLSRLKAGTNLFADLQTEPVSITHLLREASKDEVETTVWLGQNSRVRCRLFARRLSKQLADERLRKLRYEAQREGKTLSADQTTLACWSVLVTNVPDTLLSLNEAFVLYRVRWQIELLFKLWKSEAHLDVSRSVAPWRILTELFAKLLGVLIQHWFFLIGCWHCPFRSLTKAAQTIRKFTFALALAFSHPPLFSLVVSCVRFVLSASCRLNPRRTHPNTCQRLLALA
jgi:hypothetical protein